MARTYKRDARGRFSGGGGGGKGRPKAKAAPTRAGNRLTRDNAGKITSIGGNGATARGGRLKTATGNQRATQTARLKGAPAGTIKKGGRVGKAAANTKRTVYRSKQQASKAQRERSRQLVEFASSAPGAKGTIGSSLRRRVTTIPQGNLLTGGVDRLAVRTRVTLGESRIGASAASKKTAKRRARAEARYETLLQQRKGITSKGRLRNGELAQNSQRMGAVGGAFRVYDMGTGRRPPRKRTGRRVRNSGDRN